MSFASAFSRSSVNSDLTTAHGDVEHFVERVALLQIVKYLEGECQRQEEIWRTRDQEFAQQMLYAGVQYAAKPLSIERVSPANFFVGARPSLIGTSIDFWPSVTSRCAVSGASRSMQTDQSDAYDARLIIEVLCKAGPVRPDELHAQPGVDAEGEVNRQIKALSAAVHMCFRRDPSFGGRIPGIAAPPNSTTGLPSALPGDNKERSGPYYLYIGRRMQYTLQGISY